MTTVIITSESVICPTCGRYHGPEHPELRFWRYARNVTFTHDDEGNKLKFPRTRVQVSNDMNVWLEL